MNEKALIVAAHPDDEVLGCGATIARHVAKGDVCRIVILGGGLRARGAIDSEQLGLLRKQSKEAAAVLGVEELEHYDFPDNAMDTVSLLEIIKVIEKQIELFAPSVIYTHFQGDLNVDHSITSRATVTAARPFAGSSVKEVWSYEVLSSTEWNFQNISDSFHPQLFVDVKDFMAQKIRAMKCYTSELQEYPAPRSVEMIENLAARRGTQSGCHAAEAFQLLYKICR
ncbi:PIG-L deacetylase family protein [Desulfovibrio sp. JC010]|uniref:PIG-L deacetylase family protein n=1 Tax=Desulfovibrio sp. JC010 TaxID=2593641 RepID=UPI0013D5315D